MGILLSPDWLFKKLRQGILPSQTGGIFECGEIMATDIDERMEEGFQVVAGRKRRRVASSASSTASEVSKETLTKVFIRTETKKLNPARVQRQVSELVGRKDVKIISCNNLLIVLAKNDAEIAMLSQIKDLDGVSANARVAAKPKYCIIGVPACVDDETVKECTGCEKATRVIKSVGGKKEVSSVVILSFQGATPERVKIGYLSFKVKPYLREPTRCFKCNAYGHIAASCANKAKCPRCLGEHSLKECQNSDAEKCATCDSTSHHTGQAACPQRKIEKEAILLRASKHISYAKALTSAKNKIEGKPSSASVAPKVSMTTPSSSQDKQAETEPQEPAQGKKTKRKRNKRKKAKVTAEVSEKPSEPIRTSEEVQMHIPAELFAKIIKDLAQQVNLKYNGGDKEKLAGVFSFILATAFQCMQEDPTPEATQTATKTCFTKSVHHE